MCFLLCSSAEAAAAALVVVVVVVLDCVDRSSAIYLTGLVCLFIFYLYIFFVHVSEMGRSEGEGGAEW